MALKNCIMLNVSLTKTDQNTQGDLPSIPKNHAEINEIDEAKNYFFPCV